MAGCRMKLELSRVALGKGRLGVLKGLGKTGQLSLEVPGYLLHTHLGTVPHLTQDTLSTLSTLPSVTQITLSNIAEHQEVLEEFKDGFRKFAGLHDTVLYCALHDPATPCPTGHTTNKTVSVWGSGGRIELTVAKFMALQKAVKPDWYQSMADGETWQINTSHKRELEGVEVFGVVEGGDILEERVRSAKETAKRPVSGFCLDGLQTGSMDQALRTQLISVVTKELPEDKPRLLQGVGRPDEVLESVEAGVDLFEGFFPFEVTERGCALIFNFNISSNPELAVLEPGEDQETAGDSQHSGDLNPDDQTQMTSFEINLKDKRYQGDFRPLLEGCGCYCCRNHQRAYLHHLLVTNELLAGVLLMIHNTAHYHAFFSALRDAMAEDTLDLLKRRVLGQTERKD
ncbi:Queuine tRNA-ribosyltransferase accessory subunit 2 [Dissostichus eleginoides]|uniref:Queuine tRNA-ribosyltransferase accessory subunit 2 n=1 Tax=Dissostichus eleginoides TaxID=100907 RepID=A0AAD9BLV0_DISEL|nr:Queuine tRNA-ribosyltransferase accessory subunit 2 [Dissostichus eleginoides]